MTMLLDDEIFGFIKPSIDAHSLGISTISNLLIECGYNVFIAPLEVSQIITDIQRKENFSVFQKWIFANKITQFGFSYRLDPMQAKKYFCDIFFQLRYNKMFVEDGGTIQRIFFAGLTDSCNLVQQELGQDLLVFPGGESPATSLRMLNVPEKKFQNDILNESAYDEMRWDFAEEIINSGKYKSTQPLDHLNYKDAGTERDSYLKRLDYCLGKKTLPIIRAHVGPYNPNKQKAIEEFLEWVEQLADKNLLDVLSIGTSQLTQSNFGEDWQDQPNGGGVPINSKDEYLKIKIAAKDMLVRTYAGTKNIKSLSMIHEETLNISWHALSFWWFCEIDGRGENTVLENLKEHISTLKYIAFTEKPLEPNVPHHFAFRGGDDLSYIISAYLASKVAKKNGIKHLILQNMLNTPKSTWGLQDLAKARAMLKLVRELEDNNFKVSLQTRAGLDYFSPDLEKAKIQLAAVTAMMDDIEPNNDNSPEIIHVVSYSEAFCLATPDIINESIQITLQSLFEYRELKKNNKINNSLFDQDLSNRMNELYWEAKESINLLEQYIENLYTAEGLFFLFKNGFFPIPYMVDSNSKYPLATNYLTTMKNGGVRVVNANGRIIPTPERYRVLLNMFLTNKDNKRVSAKQNCKASTSQNHDKLLIE